jgi:hypothetical protein
VDEVVAWLLAGGVAIENQARRDLLGEDRPDLRRRVPEDAYAAALLAARGPDGHWGRGFYQPKWTSSHYTLLELRNLEVPREQAPARDTVSLILGRHLGADGGLRTSRATSPADACINGMALDYAAWFGGDPEALARVVDFLLGQRLDDGGFNCQANRGGARHSSMHTTASVVEGISTYLACGGDHRADDLDDARQSAVEFLLRHRLFRSERTGEVIRDEFTRLHHPARWYYDVLRGLECAAAVGRLGDDRVGEALDLLGSRRRTDGRWATSRHYPGATHVPPEAAGRPGRWVTLRALRILRSVSL